MKKGLAGMILGGLVLAIVPFAASGDSADDIRTVAALDTQYQAAVKNNDAATMDRILADDFVVVTGSGKIYTKADLLQMARTRRVQYEHQEDSDQTVRVWGDTAVVTAKIWLKGIDEGKPFEWHLWFSDTYVRTPAGDMFTDKCLCLCRTRRIERGLWVIRSPSERFWPMSRRGLRNVSKIFRVQFPGRSSNDDDGDHVFGSPMQPWHV